MAEKQTIKAGDVGTLKVGEDGTLVIERANAEKEAAIAAEREENRKRHNARMIAAIDGGLMLAGVRLHDSGGEKGVVVTFAEGEAAPVIRAIREVIAARK